MRLKEHITEVSKNKINKDVYNELKGMTAEMVGIQRAVRQGDFPYDEPENLKEALELKFTEFKMRLNGIISKIQKSII